MKIMNLLTIGLCAMALTLTVGCASDDDTDTPATTEEDATTTEDDAATTEDDATATEDDATATEDDATATEDDAATTEDDAAATEDDAAAVAPGNCTNESDLAILQDPANDIEGDAGVFGQSCLTDPDISACTTAKLLEKYDLTEECGFCFADIVTCTVQKCLLNCAADPAADACICCRQTEGCTDSFYACTGLPNDSPPDCD